MKRECECLYFCDCDCVCNLGADTAVDVGYQEGGAAVSTAESAAQKRFPGQRHKNCVCACYTVCDCDCYCVCM